MGADLEKLRGVRIAISADHLTATLVIDPDVDPNAVTEHLVEDIATDRGIITFSDRARVIREALENFAHADHHEPFQAVIANGTPPAHGIDGHISFEPGMNPNETAAEAPPPPSDEDKAIDYYNQSAYTVVKKGQLIGRILEPTQGIDGYDVTGKSLAAKHGRPYELATDESILIDRDRRLIAQKSGIVDFTGTRLRVFDELSVAEFVDFSTGNIDFPGNVNVDKGIKDCFQVTVGGSLVVRELVEAAHLNVAVDCTLHRGIASRGKGSVKTGRDLSANYIDNTHVIVGRDLHVLKEISGCEVRVSRAVRSKAAALVGGNLVVGQQCELGQVGSEAGTLTTIALGRLPEIDDLARKTAELLPQAERHARRLRKRFETLLNQGPNVTAEQAEELNALERDVPNADLAVARIKESLERLCQTHEEHTTSELRVERCIHAGVRLFIGTVEATLTRNLRGPITIWLDQGVPKAGDPHDPDAPRLASVANVKDSDRFPDLASLGRPHNQAKAA